VGTTELVVSATAVGELLTRTRTRELI